VVKLTREPVNIVRGKPFDWSISLEIANGGLIEVSDVYPNEAPIEGYKSSVAINVAATEDIKDWQSSLRKSFYFKSRGGQNYGRITINVTADFQPPPTSFGAEIYTNPSGSRNLEYDKNKEISRGLIHRVGLEKAIEGVKGASAKASSPALTPEEQEKQDREDFENNRRTR